MNEDDDTDLLPDAVNSFEGLVNFHNSFKRVSHSRRDGQIATCGPSNPHLIASARGAIGVVDHPPRHGGGRCSPSKASSTFIIHSNGYRTADATGRFPFE